MCMEDFSPYIFAASIYGGETLHTPPILLEGLLVPYGQGIVT